MRGDRGADHAFGLQGQIPSRSAARRRCPAIATVAEWVSVGHDVIDEPT